MTWGNIDLAQVNRNPLASISLPPNAPTRMLYGRAAAHIESLNGLEKQLFESLDISTFGLNGQHVPTGAFRNFLNDHSPTWMHQDGGYNALIFDDLWQVHAALQGAQKCLDLWHRAFLGIDSTMTVPKPRLLPQYLDWLQELFDVRVQLAQAAISESSHGIEVVKKFYDDSRRAALNMRQGAEAVFHHMTKPV